MKARADCHFVPATAETTICSRAFDQLKCHAEWLHATSKHSIYNERMSPHCQQIIIIIIYDINIYYYIYLYKLEINFSFEHFVIADRGTIHTNDDNNDQQRKPTESKPNISRNKQIFTADDFHNNNYHFMHFFSSSYFSSVMSYFKSLLLLYMLVIFSIISS